MSTLAAAIGVAFILVGVLIVVSPERLLSVVDWESRRGLYIAATTRVLTGLVLMLAASASRTPSGFRIIGAIGVLTGLAFTLTPTARWAKGVRWWTKEHRALYRGSRAVAILLGAFIAYGALP